MPGTRSGIADSVVRTAVPFIVGVVLSDLARAGVHVDNEVLGSAITVVLATAYYATGRIIETRNPKLGRFLLSAGLIPSTPMYVGPLTDVPPADQTPAA